MIPRQILILCVICVVAKGQASSDDRFIKKYAMMKIYESCFGPEVVKQIRQEMKEAYAKCSAPPSFEPPMNSQNIPSMLLGKLPPGFAIDPNTQTITRPGDGAAPNLDNDLTNFQQDQQKPPPNILAFKPQMFPQQQQPMPPYMMPSASPQYRPFSGANPFYQFPYNAPGMFYPPASPGLQYNPYQQYQQQYPQQYYQQQPYFASHRMSFPYNAPCMIYSPASSGLQYNPYQQYQQQYPQQYYQQQPYFASHRMSREMDLDRLDLINRAPNPNRVRNITCVMQELGYVDHNLEPNYEKITERISNLPVSSELKGDIQDGLQFCQKFSQCVPDIKRNVAPLSQEMVKPMFFFRCYKHKKLEACIMKDIRERFTTEEELEADSDFRSLGRSARSIREEPLHDPRFEALDEMAVYLYDYLSGGNGFDFDMYM